MAEQKRSLRIFLAEDHQPDVALIKEALNAAGFDVALERAADGELALETLSRYSVTDRPDAIILDLNLPKVNGFSRLSALRTNPALAAVPVAILTSSRELADREEALRQGAAAFISKPPNLDDFMQAVVGGVRIMLSSRRDQPGSSTRPHRVCGHAPDRQRFSTRRRYRELVTCMGVRCSAGIVK